MARYDRVLIDPDSRVIDLALQQAVESANNRRRLRRVPWPLPGRETLNANLAAPTGHRQWNGGDGPPRPGEGRSVVALAWWTDRAGRKHLRIVGRHGLFTRPMLEDLLCPLGEPRPPLWFVYPEYVFLMHAGEERLLQAICACGAHGSPEELGWMGPSCDTCFDLDLEGSTPAPAWLDPRQATFHTDEGRLLSLAYSRDGSTLAACTGRNHVTLWDTATGQERGRLVAPEEDWVLGAGWLDGGSRLVTLDAGGRLRFWSGKTALPTGEVLTVGASESFAVSPDGTLAARGNRTGVSLVSTTGNQTRLEGDLPGAGVLAFSPDGSLLAAGNRQGTVTVWEIATRRQRGRLDRPGTLITGLAFAPSGRSLAVALHPAPGSSVAEAECILLWDVKEREPGTSFPGHRGGCRCVGFSPDGRMLASGGEDGLLRLWDVHTQQQRVALEWHLDCVSSVAFAPDGLTLASGCFDGTIKLWPREILRPPARLHACGTAGQRR